MDLNEDGIAQKMRYDELRSLLTEHFKTQLQNKKAEIDAEGRLTAQQRTEIEELASVTRQAQTDGGRLATQDVDDDELLRRFVAKFQLPISPKSKQYGWLRTEIANSYVGYLNAILKYDDSLTDYDFSDIQPPVHTKEANPTLQKGLSIGTLGAHYRAEKEVGGNWATRTKLEKVDHIKLIEEILGPERDIRSLSALDAKKVKDTLVVLPKNRFKKAATKNKTLSEIIDMEGLERVQVPTINKYLQTYNDMFEWARRNGHVDTNLFSGLFIRQKRKSAQDRRDAFSEQQINLLLQTLTDNRNNLIRKHYQKWGPLIGLYTGARLNEIAQIELADIQQEDGIWFFDLNDDGNDKHLKSVAARRRIPIHRQLLTFGLLAEVERLRRRGSKHFFPDLTDSVEHGRGRNLGRWFNEKLLPKLGIKSEALVFHSLRHTVVTKLMHADVEEPIVKALVGHAQIGVTQNNYFKGYSIHQLNKAMQTLDYHSAFDTGSAR